MQCSLKIKMASNGLLISLLKFYLKHKVNAQLPGGFFVNCNLQSPIPSIFNRPAVFLVMNYRALQWLHNFKDTVGITAFWLRMLAPFDYEVRHWPVKSFDMQVIFPESVMIHSVLLLPSSNPPIPLSPLKTMGNIRYSNVQYR